MHAGVGPGSGQGVNRGRSTMPAGLKQPCLRVGDGKGNRLPVFQKKRDVKYNF